MTHGTRSIGLALVSLGLTLGFAGKANADASLSLAYSIETIGGGLYEYNFTLGIDTSTGPLTAGQGWGWIVFGDTETAPSPLTDFSLVGSIQGGPWTGIQDSGGDHNGPTLGPLVNGSHQWLYWQPTSITDTIQWSGTSTADILPGQLLFSNLLAENGSTYQNFAVATDPPPLVPEPSTLALGLAGLVACLGSALWRRWRLAQAPV